MSMKPAKILEKLSEYSEAVSKNIVKCCAFGDTSDDFDTWCNDVAGYLLIAVTLVGTQLEKLKPKKCEQAFFGARMDNWDDAQFCTVEFRHMECGKGRKYPEFAVEPTLVDTVFEKFEMFKKIFGPLFGIPDIAKFDRILPKVKLILEDVRDSDYR